MKYLPYIVKHLRRNWLRTGSTIAGMAVCIFLICTLQTMTEALRQAIDAASPNRLITRHSVSLVFNLPNSYGPKLAGMPGVTRVAAANWFGGYWQDMKNFFPNFAIESEPYLAMHPEFKVPPDQLDAYMRDMKGAIIGRQTADKFGWKIGDVFQMQSIIPPYQTGRPFEFTIRAIYDVDERTNPGTDRTMMFFHYKYLYESTGQRVAVGTYALQIDDPSRAAAIAKTIDAAFENSDVQTKTETEKAFLSGFAALTGNLALLLNSIGLAVAFTILLVTANTMSMAVRERRTEIAVLKTLGFPSGLVMWLVLAEAIVIAVAAASLGLLMAWGLVTILPSLPGAGALGMFGISRLTLSPTVATLTFGVAVVLGILAGFVPAYGSYRARITEMLRPA